MSTKLKKINKIWEKEHSYPSHNPFLCVGIKRFDMNDQRVIRRTMIIRSTHTNHGASNHGVFVMTHRFYNKSWLADETQQQQPIRSQWQNQHSTNNYREMKTSLTSQSSRGSIKWITVLTLVLISEYDHKPIQKTKKILKHKRGGGIPVSLRTSPSSKSPKSSKQSQKTQKHTIK